MLRPVLFLLIPVTCACVGTSTPEPVRIVDLRTGRDASFESMVSDLLQARAIYLGEEHDREDHHELQAAVLRAVHRRDPSLAVGMEMFQRPTQPALDAYVSGAIDLDEMLRRTEWDERWGFDAEMYAPVLEHARAHHLPLVALNAPRVVTRTIARQGVDGLAEEQRRALAELDLSDARHRAMVEEALGSHGGMAPDMLERFYTAQVVWDETMAETVARTLTAPGAPRRMVILAGRMHVLEGLGIPRRAGRRGARPWRVVLPVSSEDDLAQWRGSPETRPADWLVVF